MPKSGSSYLTRYLYTGLGLGCDAPPRPAGGFPAHWLTPAYVGELRSRAAFVWQVHLHPAPVNTAVLAAGGIDRIVLHLRDPRQATLSWVVHHALSLRVHTYGQGDAFYASPFADQLESALLGHFSILCDWAMQWLEVARRQDPLLVLVTDFDELKSDAAALGRRICDYYGVDFNNQGDAPALPLGPFYRRGERDEWRRVFTPEQAARCWAEMTDRGLADRWGP